jgi:hypothetical protein
VRHTHFDKAVYKALSGKRGSAPSPCPDENVIAAYLEAGLTGEEKAQFEDHTSECASCRELLGTALNLSEPPSAAAPSPPVRRRALRFFIPATAAAVVVLAVVTGVLLLQTFREDETPQSAALRTSEPTPMRVSGPDAIDRDLREKSRVETPPSAPASPPARVQSNAMPAAAAPTLPREKEVRSPALEPVPPEAAGENKPIAADDSKAADALAVEGQAAAAGERRQVDAFAIRLGDTSQQPAPVESRRAYRVTPPDAVAISAGMDQSRDSSLIRKVGKLTFRRVADYWVDSRCSEQKEEAPRVVPADAATLVRILEEYPGLKELVETGTPVILRYQDRNYVVAK